MSTTTVRIDDDLKAEVNAILDSMGLNFNTFVNMAACSWCRSVVFRSR